MQCTCQMRTQGHAIEQVKANSADNCVGEMAEASTSAQRRWELENNVQVDEEVEGFFRYNHAEQQAVQQQKPWSKDPHLYKQ